MTYFKNCSTIEEIKSLYKTLAKENHPDVGGSTEIMQKINSEYAFACANILKNGRFTAEEMENEILNAEAYKDAVNSVVNLDGIIVELVGAWLWITGNTYQHRHILKAAHFMFASKKIAWYFRTDEYKVKNYGHKLTLANIKNKYGSQQINSEENKAKKNTLI